MFVMVAGYLVGIDVCDGGRLLGRNRCLRWWQVDLVGVDVCDGGR